MRPSPRQSPTGPFAIAAAALALGACEPRENPVVDTAAPQAATGPVGEAGLEGALHVIADAGRLERGETDARYDWVSVFERDTGCQLTAHVVDTATERRALLARGGIDLVIATGEISLQMIRSRAAQPLDLERVPSFVNVDERLARAPWHHVDGLHYGVPFQWGPHVLLYSTPVFKTPPRSWSVAYEEQKLPDGRSNRGRILASDDPMSIADAALYLRARRPDLGISNPYSLDEPQYAAVLDLLRAQRTLVQRYGRDAQQLAQHFRQEGVVIASGRAGDVHPLVADGQAVAGVVPVEGATGWAETTLLANGAPHPNCAYKWLEWSLNARLQGDVAARNGSVPAVPAACRRHVLLGETGCARNGAEHFDRIEFGRTPDVSCATGACVPFERWAVDFAELPAGR